MTVYNLAVYGDALRNVHERIGPNIDFYGTGEDGPYAPHTGTTVHTQNVGTEQDPALVFTSRAFREFTPQGDSIDIFGGVLRVAGDLNLENAGPGAVSFFTLDGHDAVDDVGGAATHKEDVASNPQIALSQGSPRGRDGGVGEGLEGGGATQINGHGNGGSSGAGGAGGASGSNAGGIAGEASVTYKIPISSPTDRPTALTTSYTMEAIGGGATGASGGAGAGDDTEVGGGAGGAPLGGAYGIIFARRILVGPNTSASAIRCIGGKGGKGGNAVAGNAAGGGGASGGGGGALIVVCDEIVGHCAHLIDCAGGDGGDGGDGHGTGEDGHGGYGGAAGDVHLYVLGTGIWLIAKGTVPVAPVGQAGGVGEELLVSV